MDSTYALTGSPSPTLKRFADLNGPDYYPTPAWATHALMESEAFEGPIWEPACGDGSMARVLEQYGHFVTSSDLCDRGFGEAGHDFLATTRRAPNIITNPPFHSAEGFARQAFAQSSRKSALLLRLAFLESAHRANTLFGVMPPARVWVFSERITFYPAGAERGGSGTLAYAWFIWDHAHTGPTELKWITPGLKAKHSRRLAKRAGAE